MPARPLLMTALVLLACEGRPPEAARAAPARGETSRADAGTAPTDAAARAEASAAQGEGATARRQEGARSVETPRYDFLVEETRACESGAPPPTGRLWVGVAARVKSKGGDLFVTARDVSLAKEGVILGARHVNAPLLPRCLPLLAPTQLRAGQAAHGFVLFEMPLAWRGAETPLVLAYQPTRWGGGQRIEIRIPACLDTCPDTLASSRSKKSHKAFRP